MPLGTQNMQAAQSHDPLVLRVGFLLKFGEILLVQLTRVQHRLGHILVVANGLHDDFLRNVLLTHTAAGQIVRVAAQQNIRAAARHVGGDGDRAHMTGLGHNFGFLLVVFGVQHLMGHAPQLNHVGQHFAGFHVDGAHQNGLARGVAGHDFLHHGVKLAPPGLVDHVVHVLADHGAVGGNLHHVQVVDALKFFFLGLGGTGHAGQLVVHAEVVLEGDGGQGFALPLHLYMLLGLDGLMQAVGVAAAHHQAAGELVHNHNLAVLHHIVHIPLHQGMGLQGGQNVVVQLLVVQIGDVVHPEMALGLVDALLGQGNGLFLFLNGVVLLIFEAGHKTVGLFVQIGGFVPLTGDNQRRAGLVNQDGVHLVHNGKGVAPLHHIAFTDDHIIPQVVKAHFVVGAVGNVAGIGGPALGVIHIMHDNAYGHAHKAEDVSHPLALKFGQIVVDGDDMHAFAGQGVQIGGQGGGVGFALAGFHLGNAALMQADAADDLHRKQALAVHAPYGLAKRGESVGQNLVQRFAVLQAGLQFRGFGLQLLVCQGLAGILQRKHFIGNLLQTPDLGVVALAKQFFESFHHSQSGRSPSLSTGVKRRLWMHSIAT